MSVLTKKLQRRFKNPQNSYEQIALDVYNLLVENFSKTYFVGGSIRDIILDKSIYDIDITTIATPDEVIKLLKNLNFTLDLKGKRFGVVAINHKKQSIEVATFRKDSYLKSRFPKTAFIKSLVKDSERRDFTINSLYFNLKSNKLFDPYNAVSDLRSKTIKFIGSPLTKTEEDPLRIIRAYRIAQELNFNFEAKTAEALEKNFNLLFKISTTRIKNEVVKSKTLFVKKYLQRKFKKLLQK